MPAIELSDEEVVLIQDYIAADLEFVWETLKEENSTLGEAMDKYDHLSAVGLLRKLSPELADAHRKETVFQRWKYRETSGGYPPEGIEAVL